MSTRQSENVIAAMQTTIPKTEFDRLTSSDKVEGTNVYNTQGDRLRTIESFMVDKYNGRVAYVVMSFGGFL
jgi:hypothetical protein